ncbi:unnamed protein product [Euphydryas editha]|uniref:Zinc finger PHD-type domain-containing protein n=1 Tax=Euphydryas editha TaxID=104508 RepID=A0AAU9UZX9_EUPED|nr:unnamed protein product [Euphydryas editha]
MLCKKCNILFEVDGEVLCSLCTGYYHYKCSGIQESTYKRMTTEKKASWRCLPCRQSDNNDTLAELVKEIRSLKTQIMTMQDGLNKANTGISSIETKFIAIDDRLDDLDARLTLTENNVERIPSLATNFEDLKSELKLYQKNDFERNQFLRMNNIEISGVPQKHGENLLSILNCISITIGFQLQETDVDTIHRVRRFITSVDSRKDADPRHPAIIVRFCQRRRKDALMAAARERRNITTADAGLPGPCTPIYINEHLTTRNKLLLKKARDFKNQNNFKYLWVKQCKIFIRKDDKSKIYLISEDTDFAKIR